MEDLLKKISSYQLFNFLMSGAIFVMALDNLTTISLSSDDAVLSFFTYYFIGMVIGSIGSLLVEPTLKILRVIKFRSYPEYVRAVQLDSKLDTLSQENNTYRTLIATFLVFSITYAFDKCAQGILTGKSTVVIAIGVMLLILLFIFAYHKQTKYMTQRIDKALQE